MVQIHKDRCPISGNPALERQSEATGKSATPKASTKGTSGTKAFETA
jgi:hypothetical protein